MGPRITHFNRECGHLRGSRRFPPAQRGRPTRCGKREGASGEGWFFLEVGRIHFFSTRVLEGPIVLSLLGGYVDEIPATYKQPAFIGAECGGLVDYRLLRVS